MLQRDLLHLDINFYVVSPNRSSTPWLCMFAMEWKIEDGFLGFLLQRHGTRGGSRSVFTGWILRCHRAGPPREHGPNTPKMYVKCGGFLKVTSLSRFLKVSGCLVAVSSWRVLFVIGDSWCYSSTHMSSRLHSGCRKNQTAVVFLSQRAALRRPRARIWITIIPSPRSQCMAHSISACTITSSYIKSYYHSGRLRGRNADYTFWTEAVHLLKSYPVRFNANLSDAFSLFLKKKNVFHHQDGTREMFGGVIS